MESEALSTLTCFQRSLRTSRFRYMRNSRCSVRRAWSARSPVKAIEESGVSSNVLTLRFGGEHPSSAQHALRARAAIVSATIRPGIDDVRASRPGSRLLRMLNRLTRWCGWLRLANWSSGVERAGGAHDVRSHGGIDLLAWLGPSVLWAFCRGRQQGKYVQVRSRYDIRLGC